MFVFYVVLWRFNVVFLTGLGKTFHMGKTHTLDLFQEAHLQKLQIHASYTVYTLHSTIYLHSELLGEYQKQGPKYVVVEMLMKIDHAPSMNCHGFKFLIHISNLVPRLSYAFQCTWEKKGRPGQSGGVMGCGLCYLRPLAHTVHHVAEAMTTLTEWAKGRKYTVASQTTSNYNTR